MVTGRGEEVSSMVAERGRRSHQSWEQIAGCAQDTMSNSSSSNLKVSLMTPAYPPHTQVLKRPLPSTPAS